MSSDWLTVQMAELFHQETTRNVIFKPSLTLASTILQKRSQSISLKHLLPKPPPSVYFPICRHVGMMTEKAKVFVYRRATQTFCAEHHSCHSQGFSIQVQRDPSPETQRAGRAVIAYRVLCPHQAGAHAGLLLCPLDPNTYHCAKDGAGTQPCLLKGEK